MLDQNFDRPLESASTDVTLVMRGITVPACVDLSSTDLVVVRPTALELHPADVRPGDPVELYWVSGSEERILPGKVADVEEGSRPRWHLAVAGQAETSQRRKAVRARLHLPVEIPWAGAHMLGRTVDVSEAGMRVLVDGWGIPMEAGTVTQLTVTLDEQLLLLRGQVVWTVERGAQWLMALRLVDLPEKTGDLLRKRVFRALRDERAAEAAL